MIIINENSKLNESSIKNFSGKDYDIYGAEDEGSQKCKILEVELDDGMLVIALYFMDGDVNLVADVFDSMDTDDEPAVLYEYAKSVDYKKGLTVMEALDSELNPGYDYDYKSVGKLLRKKGFDEVDYR